MAKKQTPIIETVPETVAPAPRRATKPRAPRVKTATHSKTSTAAVEIVSAAPIAELENPHDAIARLAYSFWESRGCQHGSATEDWFRAESEYRSRLSLAAHA